MTKQYKKKGCRLSVSKCGYKVTLSSVPYRSVVAAILIVSEVAESQISTSWKMEHYGNSSSAVQFSCAFLYYLVGLLLLSIILHERLPTRVGHILSII